VHRSLLIAAIRIVVQLALVGVVLTTLFSYYVSGSLITKGRTDDSAGLRISGGGDRTTRERPSAPIASRSRQHLQIDFGTARGRINSAAACRADRRDR
jgi:hypothetical protein